MVNLAVDLFNLGMLFSPVDNSGAGSVTTVKLCNVIPALHFGLQTAFSFSRCFGLKFSDHILKGVRDITKYNIQRS